SIPDSGVRGGIQLAAPPNGWVDTPSLTSYASNAQVFADTDVNGNPTGPFFEGSAKLSANFPDGTTNTIMFAERFGTCGYYMNDTTFPAGSGGCVWNWWSTDSPQAAFALFIRGPNSKFQVQPLPFQTACNPLVTNTGHSGGMNVAL